MGFKSWTTEEADLLKRVADARPNGGYVKPYQEACSRQGLKIRSSVAIMSKRKAMLDQAAGLKPLPKNWSTHEINYLQELIGDYPFSLIVRHYGHWAKSNGFRHRTAAAINRIISKQDWSTEPIGEYITYGAIASLMGISFSSIRRLEKRQLIVPYICKDVRMRHLDRAPDDINRCRRYVRRSQIVQLARSNPELFAGVNAGDLLLLLEIPELAAEIAKKYPIRNGHPRPVKCTTTGKTFPSIAACATTHNCHYTNISQAIRFNRPCKGRMFAYVKPGQLARSMPHTTNSLSNDEHSINA